MTYGRAPGPRRALRVVSRTGLLVVHLKAGGPPSAPSTERWESRLCLGASDLLDDVQKGFELRLEWRLDVGKGVVVRVLR